MFRNVYLKYNNASGHAISGINFRVSNGQVAAIVGGSGGGKTTIGNLLLRFYEPFSGGIFIDDADIRDFTLNSLRRHLGIVSQDVILFNDALLKNITYGKEDFSMEEVIAAATNAYAHDFIMKMPEGYNTEVGEKGGRLSDVTPFFLLSELQFQYVMSMQTSNIFLINEIGGKMSGILANKRLSQQKNH